mmetsp:Transcript_43120/g.91752  ORF Transcript_43120/g.91752 Transcript_43120/m.91752 type:complete len:204 (+) Transcript_43120:1805-2416(+)
MSSRSSTESHLSNFFRRATAAEVGKKNLPARCCALHANMARLWSRPCVLEPDDSETAVVSPTDCAPQLTPPIPRRDTFDLTFVSMYCSCPPTLLDSTVERSSLPLTPPAPSLPPFTRGAPPLTGGVGRILVLWLPPLPDFGAQSVFRAYAISSRLLCPPSKEGTEPTVLPLPLPLRLRPPFPPPGGLNEDDLGELRLLPRSRP